MAITFHSVTSPDIDPEKNTYNRMLQLLPMGHHSRHEDDDNDDSDYVDNYNYCCDDGEKGVGGGR
jgi:hypothetical protein